MKNKVSLIIFALMVGMGTISMADDHKEHNKKMMDKKAMDKKHDHSKEFSKYNLGYWDANACKRTSDGAGALLATTGYLLDQSNKLREAGNESEADDMFVAAERLSTVAANVASAFSAFCK